MSLAELLAKSRAALSDRLAAIFSRGHTDESVMAEAEQVLIESDLGWEIAEKVVEGLRRRPPQDGRWREEVISILSESLPLPAPAAEGGEKPRVTLFVGVNGSGKTTTIARIAWRLSARGRKVLLSCADTFRAAASEQLELWGERLGIDVYAGRDGADPGSVAYDSICRAKAAGCDEVLIDTAGRLPNQQGLLSELAKVYRVCGKAMEGAPHSVLLVLDGSVGQNALSQGEQFSSALPVTGLVLTKLDGTARGGAVLAAASRLQLPIEYIGIGEHEEDLVPFDSEAFLQALLGSRETG